MWGFFRNQWMQVWVYLRCILWLGRGCGWAHMIPEHLLPVLIVCIFYWKTHEGFCSCQWACCCSVYFRWGLCSLWAQMWCSIQRGGSAENTMRHQSLGCTVEVDFLVRIASIYVILMYVYHLEGKRKWTGVGCWQVVVLIRVVNMWMILLQDWREN